MRDNTNVLVPSTLENVVTKAVESVSAPGRRVQADLIDSVVEGVILYRMHGNPEKRLSMEDVIRHRVADLLGAAHSTKVRTLVRAISTAILDAQVVGVEYQDLALREHVPELSGVPTDQLVQVLLQYVSQANERTKKVREHLTKELAERDALIRDLQDRLQGTDQAEN